MAEGIKALASNRKAVFNYAIQETLECGIELRGTEVKSIKEGKFSFGDAYAKLEQGELWLVGMHITPYLYGNINNHEPDRPRKLLVHSRLTAVKGLCILYIELIRGVPLISLLFMSSIIFPLFLPEGITINKILRAQAAIILFTAAYIAEVVRGGLQAMPRGQYEAAESLGLNYYQTMRLIILPQALKIVIPPTVSILISAFKDTSLVVIIALWDLLKTTQSVLSNPEWMGFSREAYIFIAIIYFLGCFSMSNYSRKLERELSTGGR